MDIRKGCCLEYSEQFIELSDEEREELAVKLMEEIREKNSGLPERQDIKKQPG